MTRSGFVLPGVLVALLVIGVISFAMSLVATLELLSARSAAHAVAARAAADGALALALAEVVAHANAGAFPSLEPSSPPVVYGPWPAYGIDAEAKLSAVESAVGATALLLVVEATVGRAVAGGSLVFDLDPALTLHERRRP